MSVSRLRLLLAALLVLSAAAFAVGSAIERSHAHESAQPTTEASPPAGEAGGEGTGGEAGTTEPASHVESTAGSETLFGINPESTALVAVGVILSLLLAANVWFWGHRPVLAAALVFGVVFAALDIREALHQSNESRAGLVALAIGLVMLHGAVAGVAAAALLRERSAKVMA